MGKKLKICEEAKKLNPIDDLLFRKMSEDSAFCGEILRVILSDPDLAVLECTPQFDATNLQGRSAVFDARCILGSGKLSKAAFPCITWTVSSGKTVKPSVTASRKYTLTPQLRMVQKYPGLWKFVPKTVRTVTDFQSLPPSNIDSGKPGRVRISCVKL